MLKKIVISVFVSCLFVSFLSSCSKTPEACFTIEQTVDSVQINVIRDGGRKNVPIQFSAVCSKEATDFEWSFGDTSKAVSGQKVSYMFRDSGSYKIILVVRNDKKSAETEKWIFIHNY